MKKSMVLMVILMMRGALFGREDGLALSVELSDALVTSESMSIQVVFTNTSNATITFPEPVLGRTLVLRVFDEKDNLLARSGIPIEYIGDDDKSVVKRNSLQPRESWKTESFDLFISVYPSVMLTPDQTVRVSAIYSLNGKDYEASASIDIPAHDLVIKPEYISKEKALDLARQDFEKKGAGKMDVFKDAVPTAQCINGIYRVIYSHPQPPRARGQFNVVIKIDAITGNVL